MNALLWTVVSVVGLWLGTMLFFIALMKCKVLFESDAELTPVIKGHIILFAVVGIIFDVVFNFTIGTFIYWELPKEWLFTSRCHRHKLGDPGSKRCKLAHWVCKQLNQIDPGHC